MKEIFKTLRKFSLQIILIFILLFVQAMCDLALPDYTSKIVDIGITQNGIETSVFTVASEDFFENILLFTDEDEFIKNQYELITKENSKYLDEYKILNEKNLYILKDISKNDYEKLKQKLVKPIAIMQSINNNSELIKLEMNLNEDMMKMDLFTLFHYMNEDEFNLFKETMNQNLENIEEIFLLKGAIASIKNEYELVGKSIENLQMNYTLKSGIKMLSFALLIMVISVITSYISSKIAAYFSRDLRKKVVNKVMSFSNKEFEDFSSASLITRSTNDIQQIQMLIVMLFRVVFYAPIIGFGALGKVSGSSMAWVIGIAVLTIMVIMIILFTVALPKFNIVQKMIDKLQLVARERLTGISVIRAFATDKHEEKKFDVANKDLTKVNLFVNRTIAFMMPTMMFIMSSISILIIWVGSKKIDAGTIEIGSLMAFISYTMQIIMAFLMIAMVSIMIPRALVSIKRISEIFKKESTVKEKQNATKLGKIKGIIEFKDVYFRYHDAKEDVLKNINFKASPGSITAFIGSTGSGKSTLINLIPRFFDVTGGKILIDGININDVTFKSLRSKIGYVPQKGNLFTGTIASNIGFGKEQISKKDLEKAARISQSLDFINKKEEKFNSAISQSGTNVSGGQKQRLAIARAIAINPNIYIFDDSFSALDYKTDSKLRKELFKETKNSTIFIVTQRISTILNADQIVVLDKGEIKGIGTHKELIKTCDVYKEIASSQLSKEEIEYE